MQVELRRVEPVRAANVLALLYALSFMIVAIPMFFIFSMIPDMAGTTGEGGAMQFSNFRWFLIAYPIMGLVFGWLQGLIGAFLYNIIASRTGGFQFELPQVSMPIA
jgi:hypothetical protein